MRKIDCVSARLDDTEVWDGLAPDYKNRLYALCRYWDVGFYQLGSEAQFDLRAARSREYFWRRESTSKGIFLKGFDASGLWSDAARLGVVLDELVRLDYEPFDDKTDWGARLRAGQVYDPWRPENIELKSGLRNWRDDAIVDFSELPTASELEYQYQKGEKNV